VKHPILNADLLKLLFFLCLIWRSQNMNSWLALVKHLQKQRWIDFFQSESFKVLWWLPDITDNWKSDSQVSYHFPLCIWTSFISYSNILYIRPDVIYAASMFLFPCFINAQQNRPSHWILISDQAFKSTPLTAHFPDF